MIWPQSQAAVSALATAGLADLRALLIEAGARSVGIAFNESVTFSPTLPVGRRVLALLWDETKNPETATFLLAADSEAGQWLEKLRKKGPLRAALRMALRESPHGHLLKDFPTDDFRIDEMAMGTKLLSAFSMSGME